MCIFGKYKAESHFGIYKDENKASHLFLALCNNPPYKIFYDSSCQVKSWTRDALLTNWKVLHLYFINDISFIYPKDFMIKLGDIYNKHT